jgi:pimeloyl-ACP methyl ester carboxylesterase
MAMTRRLMLAGGALLAAQPARAAASFPGTPTPWEGGQRHDFTCDGRPATVVVPARPAPGRPWLWRGEFFGAFPAVDVALLARGWHIAYLDCKDTFGSPETLRHWDAFYRELVGRYGLARRPVLLGMSRGGLYVYRWAAANPDKVGLIHGDAPVCDIKSWPAGKGKGIGNPPEWTRFKQVYGLSEEQALQWKGNPIDLLAPLARARIPILHVVGDADDKVPVAENTTILAQRYEKLGGHVEVINKPGVGHHPHSLSDPAPIVDYILAHRLK